MRQFEVTQRPRLIRRILLVFFYLWALGGAIVALADILPPSIGLGGLAALAINPTVWIGGLLFFGLGAIAAPSTYTIDVVEVATRPASR